MKILVIGGTGTVGGRVTRDLIAYKEDVRVLTRSAEHARSLPQGAQAAIGDLQDPGSLSPAFDDMEAVFMVTPLHPDETKLGETAVDAARKAGCRRFVYSSVIMPPGSEQIPHFRSKIPVEEAVKASGMEYTVLRPTNFYQNDLGLRLVIQDYGIYPQPLGHKGVNRVDVRDIADAATTALTHPGFTGKTFDVGGPHDWTGGETAAIWSRYLGREVRYEGDDLNAWTEQARKVLPEFLVRDFRVMYQFFLEHGISMPDSAYGPLRELLGHDPDTYEAFVEETAEIWKRQPVGTSSGT